MPKKVHLGDKGETFLIGKRISKIDCNISSLGTLDELNSSIGLACSLLKDRQLQDILEKVQNDLFLLGEEIVKRDQPAPRTKLSQGDIEFLEKSTESLESELKLLKRFILPGGCQAASALHVARTVCRRCEREIVALMKNGPLDDKVLVYINRLSDFLFVMARTANQRLGVQEKTWGPELV